MLYLVCRKHQRCIWDVLQMFLRSIEENIFRKNEKSYWILYEYVSGSIRCVPVSNTDTYPFLKYLGFLVYDQYRYLCIFFSLACIVGTQLHNHFNPLKKLLFWFVWVLTFWDSCCNIRLSYQLKRRLSCGYDTCSICLTN
jgi:hypothetical protein